MRGSEGQTEERPRNEHEDEGGLELAILFVQQALISVYEHKCPLKPATTGIHSLQWARELGVPQKRSEKAL